MWSYRILFNYVIANGDAHLRNISLQQGPFGDYVLSPAYDLLNTLLHFPNEMGRTALELFKDSEMPEFAALGYFTEPDFVKLGECFGVSEDGVHEMIYLFHKNRQQVEDMVTWSFLSSDAKIRYLEIFNDGLMSFHRTKEKSLIVSG